MTLTEFLLARIAEDERAADVAEEYVAKQWGGNPTASAITVSDHDGTPLWSSDHLRRDAEAKRRIVEMVEQKRSRNTVTTSWIEALMVLAVPYDDHPDYRPEWKP